MFTFIQPIFSTSPSTKTSKLSGKGEKKGNSTDPTRLRTLLNGQHSHIECLVLTNQSRECCLENLFLLLSIVTHLIVSIFPKRLASVDAGGLAPSWLGVDFPPTPCTRMLREAAATMCGCARLPGKSANQDRINTTAPILCTYARARQPAVG